MTEEEEPWTETGTSTLASPHNTWVGRTGRRKILAEGDDEDEGLRKLRILPCHLKTTEVHFTR